MSSISITKLYELLSTKIGKEPAESLTSFIGEKISDEMEKKANTLGFRATSQLRHLKKNPKHYRQLFIQMVGSNEDHKLELLGVLKDYKVVNLTVDERLSNLDMKALAPKKLAEANKHLKKKKSLPK